MQENILHPFHISACVSECVWGGGGGHESYLAQYKHTGIVFSIPKKLPQATYEHRYILGCKCRASIRVQKRSGLLELGLLLPLHLDYCVVASPVVKRVTPLTKVVHNIVLVQYWDPGAVVP